MRGMQEPEYDKPYRARQMLELRYGGGLSGPARVPREHGTTVGARLVI